jgi:hypothetical protein
MASDAGSIWLRGGVAGVLGSSAVAGLGAAAATLAGCLGAGAAAGGGAEVLAAKGS